MIAPSIFDSFNARNLEPSQVAATFIAPPDFGKLILRRHSLIVGPRGSGKTTLLKMLQVPALMAWNDESSGSDKKDIDFIGVFIPADISWSAQLGALSSRPLASYVADTLGNAAFTNHVLIALVEAMQQAAMPRLKDHRHLSHLYCDLPREKEEELVQLLADAWKLSIQVRSFLGLRLALRRRLSDIAEVAQQESGRDSTASVERIRANQVLHIPFLESASLAIDAFNTIVGKEWQKWGLLFDELEIAPASIRRTLLAALRSTYPKLLFKLSISPYSEGLEPMQGAAAPMPSNDYDPIFLWYTRKEDGLQFSTELANAMLRAYGCKDTKLSDIFAPSALEAPEGARSAPAYKVNSPLWRAFKELADSDSSFADFLKSRKVDINAIDKMKEKDRAENVRKVTPLVVIRVALRSRFISGLRSRKNPRLYLGYRSLFAVVEGNPRWFIGVVAPLLKEYARDKVQISAVAQTKAIAIASHRFRALLKTVPYVNESRSKPGQRGLLTLLDRIGEYFFDGLVRADFQAEPPLSFVVDSNTSRNLEVALGKALNAGAIVVGDDSLDEPLFNSLKSKRFRLSYMLATYYRLPLNLGREISLHSILRDEAPVDLFGFVDGVDR